MACSTMAPAFRTGADRSDRQGPLRPRCLVNAGSATRRRRSTGFNRGPADIVSVPRLLLDQEPMRVRHSAMRASTRCAQSPDCTSRPRRPDRCSSAARRDRRSRSRDTSAWSRSSRGADSSTPRRYACCASCVRGPACANSPGSSVRFASASRSRETHPVRPRSIRHTPRP